MEHEVEHGRLLDVVGVQRPPALEPLPHRARLVEWDALFVLGLGLRIVNGI